MVANMSANTIGACYWPDHAAVTRTEIGSRHFQQDYALICDAGEALFTCLCDGMGGTAQGGEASQRTADILHELFSDAEIYEMALKRPIDFLRLVLTVTDEAISGDATLHGSGTTLTSLLLIGHQVYWASVGDSRLYIIRGNEIVQATRDHNYRLYLDTLMDQKRIGQNRYEAELVRGRALISYIGIGGLRLFDLTRKPFEICPGDIFLLTSDGLTGLLSEQEILSILQFGDTLEQRADQLMRTALARGQGRPMDNTTFILIQMI